MYLTSFRRSVLGEKKQALDSETKRFSNISVLDTTQCKFWGLTFIIRGTVPTAMKLCCEKKKEKKKKKKL